MGDVCQWGVMGQMGMFIIGLFCMVFYCVLIILSVFQNDWCSGELRGGLGEGDGTMDRDGFLLPLHLFGWSVYLALQQPALSHLVLRGYVGLCTTS